MVKVRVSRVRVSRIRVWPELERPTCRIPSEWHRSRGGGGGLRLARWRRVRVS